MFVTINRGQFYRIATELQVIEETQHHRAAAPEEGCGQRDVRKEDVLRA